MWNLLVIVFNTIGVFLLFQFARFKYIEYKRLGDRRDYWSFSRHKYVLTVGGFLVLSLSIIELLLPDVSPLVDEADRLSMRVILGVSTSLAISVIWAVYLRKLDIFDPERWSHIAAVICAGGATSFLVFPISDAINGIGFSLNGSFLNDFLYCVVGIGAVEEFVKLLPLLVVIRFKRIVREPYDFLLYASVSALGFAFVENAMYISKSNFFAVNGRALTATVAHMTFSSVLGYGVMISMYKKHWLGWRYFVGAFLLASVMHGFYDFWLINPLARQYNGLTFLFFLLTTHFWFSMKNKTINASRFFDPHRKLINDRLRYFLIFWLTALLMGSALVIGVLHGKDSAHSFLRGQIMAYGFLLYYLSFSFSRFKLAPRMLSAGQKVFDAVIPDQPDASHWGGE
jgi:RsiW-degrading membrane proteinase PrsW (M82 family)